MKKSMKSMGGAYGKKLTAVLLSVVIFSLGAGGGFLTYASNGKASVNQPAKEQDSLFEMEENREYTLTIGLNDKDTYVQVIETEAAKELVNAVCVKYVEGYTCVQAAGGWVDEKEKLTQENTLIYYFRDAEEEQIKQIMDEVLIALNQDSILLEEKTGSYTLYYGIRPEKTE